MIYISVVLQIQSHTHVSAHAFTHVHIIDRLYVELSVWYIVSLNISLDLCHVALSSLVWFTMRYASDLYYYYR